MNSVATEISFGRKPESVSKPVKRGGLIHWNSTQQPKLNSRSGSTRTHGNPSLSSGSTIKPADLSLSR